MKVHPNLKGLLEGYLIEIVTQMVNGNSNYFENTVDKYLSNNSLASVEAAVSPAKQQKKNIKFNSVEKKINSLYRELDQKCQDYFNEYVNMEKKNAHYYLLVGKCNAIGDAMELLQAKYPVKL